MASDAEPPDLCCQVCGGTEHLSRCAACKEHQKADWINHKAACRLLRDSDKAAEEQRRMRAAEEEQKRVEKTRSRCGNHPVGDYSKYVHALNNMAGCHRIDSPLDNETTGEEFSDLWENWRRLHQRMQQRNGVWFLEGAVCKRHLSSLGIGMVVKGKVLLGHIRGGELDGEEVVVEMTGAESAPCTVEVAENTSVEVNEHLSLFSGAFLDSHCVLHGPLRYCGLDIDANGGVHIDGCAFDRGGLRPSPPDGDEESAETGEEGDTEEIPLEHRYNEICIECVVRDRGE